jgi:hypothetical protein
VYTKTVDTPRLKVWVFEIKENEGDRFMKRSPPWEEICG